MRPLTGWRVVDSLSRGQRDDQNAQRKPDHALTHTNAPLKGGLGGPAKPVRYARRLLQNSGDTPLQVRGAQADNTSMRNRWIFAVLCLAPIPAFAAELSGNVQAAGRTT